MIKLFVLILSLFLASCSTPEDSIRNGKFKLIQESIDIFDNGMTYEVRARIDAENGSHIVYVDWNDCKRKISSDMRIDNIIISSSVSFDGKYYKDRLFRNLFGIANPLIEKIEISMSPEEKRQRKQFQIKRIDVINSMLIQEEISRSKSQPNLFQTPALKPSISCTTNSYGSTAYTNCH